MKILFCVVIVITCGIGGILYSDKYRKNYLFFADLSYVFNIFKIKIAFFQNSIANVIDECLPNIKSKKTFFSELIDALKQSTITEEKIIKMIDANISLDEKQLIARYFVGVSSTYEQSELSSYIENGNNYFIERQNWYKSKENTDGNLAKKLSISVGIVISILMY